MFTLSLRTARQALAAVTVIMLPFAGASAEETDATSLPGAETFSASVVADAELDSSRGAYVPDSINFNELSATNMGNTVTGGITGSNSVTGTSFNNSTGLVNVIQNSGNNVIIQSSTIVNMTLNK